MRSRLDRVIDWDARIFGADFRVARLAEACRVSERELRRYVRSRFGLLVQLRGFLVSAGGHIGSHIV